MIKSVWHSGLMDTLPRGVIFMGTSGGSHVLALSTNLKQSDFLLRINGIGFKFEDTGFGLLLSKY